MAASLARSSARVAPRSVMRVAATSSTTSSGVRAVLAVAATCVFMVLVAWATLIGPDEVFTGTGRVRAPTTTAETCIPLPVATAADGSTTVEIPDDFAARNYCEPPPGFGNGEPPSRN